MYDNSKATNSEMKKKKQTYLGMNKEIFENM